MRNGARRVERAAEICTAPSMRPVSRGGAPFAEPARAGMAIRTNDAASTAARRTGGVMRQLLVVSAWSERLVILVDLVVFVVEIYELVVEVVEVVLLVFIQVVLVVLVEIV